MSSLTKKLLVGGVIVTVAFIIVALVGPMAETPPQSTTPSESTKELIKEDIHPGNGPEAKKGDTVRVHYTGRLKDGTKFDSSLDRNDPFQFTLGASEVIKGWDLGVPGMKVGGKRKLVIPADMAYGSRPQGKIPPNSELTFEIELLEIVK